jgi:hypothetical protein
MSIYSDFNGIDYPESVIETLINVLVQTECLLEAPDAAAGLGGYHPDFPARVTMNPVSG